MYGSDKAGNDVERTAFRIAEKKYKLYYDDTFKSSKKKKQPKAVDLSEVLDFKSISETYNRKGELPLGISVLHCGFDRLVFSLDNRPGFYFISGALSVEEQCKWIRESLTSFPQPPNRTNHNAIYGPVHDLFMAAKEGKIFVEERSSSCLESECAISVSNEDGSRWKFYEESVARSIGKVCKTVSASILLRKLRWSTLGLQFEWSKRNYDVSLPHNKIPDELCQLAKRMAAPAMHSGEEFQPEAAIVNYFGSGTCKMEHLLLENFIHSAI